MSEHALRNKYFLEEHECGSNVRGRCFPNPCCVCACCCAGPPGPPGASGKSAYQIALDNGFIGTEAEWLDSLKGETGPSGPVKSSYMEALGDGQTIAGGESIIFDTASVDSVGNNIVLDPSGTVFTINHTGLYHVEWNINLAAGGAFAVVGITENGEAASGATSTAAGCLSSGTLIHVDTVPFVISLHNYSDAITIENPFQWADSAASIRIVRFADEPS